MPNPKTIAVILLASCFLAFAGRVSGQEEWHDQTLYELEKDKVTLAFSLTDAWKVSYPSEGKLVAINDKAKAAITVQITPASGKLAEVSRAFFQTATCSSALERVLAGEDEIEEIICRGQAGSLLKFGRFFLKNGNLVSVECEVPDQNYALFGDELWSTLRNVQLESEEVKITVVKGEKVYTSPDKLFRLTYPENWKIATRGRTLLLYLPNGPSIQVIPVMGNYGKTGSEVLLNFQKTFADTVKKFEVESQDTFHAKGEQAPRFTYTYLLPNGKMVKGWAVFLTFPRASFIMVCSAPVRGFDDAASAFGSTISSLEVKQ